MSRLTAVLMGVLLAGCGPATVPPKPPAPPPPVEAPPPTLILAPEAPSRPARILGKGPEGCTWVESEATVAVTPRESPSQALAAAQAEARTSAMREALGMQVQSSSIDFTQETLRGQKQLVERLNRVTQNGLILKEEVAGKGYRPIADCAECRYYIRLKTCWIGRPPHADEDFTVNLRILPRTKFVEGDEARLAVTASKDSYLYVYNVGLEGETSLLSPSPDFPQVRLAAAKLWVHPDEEGRRRGTKLIAQLPESRPVLSSEMIRVIVTKALLPESVLNPDAGGFLGVLRRINGRQVDWAEAEAPFTVEPKPAD